MRDSIAGPHTANSNVIVGLRAKRKKDRRHAIWLATFGLRDDKCGFRSASFVLATIVVSNIQFLYVNVNDGHITRIVYPGVTILSRSQRAATCIVFSAEIVLCLPPKKLWPCAAALSGAALRAVCLPAGV
jgi:hypothetical protein